MQNVSVPVHERPQPRVLDIDPGTWRSLVESVDSAEFFNAWLTLQRDRIADVGRAVVLELDRDRDEYVIAAHRAPGDSPLDDLLAAAAESVEAAQPLVVPVAGDDRGDGAEPVVIAYPVVVAGEVGSVAVFEVRVAGENDLRAAMTSMQWGAAWLQNLLLRRRSGAADDVGERLRGLLDLVATTVSRGRYADALGALVTELSTRLGCERVSFGDFRGRRCRLQSISHTGQFGRQMDLVNAIERAMDEAMDQGETVVFPTDGAGRDRITRCAAELVQRHGSSWVVTVPMRARDRASACLCFEFPGSVERRQDLVDLCETIGGLFAPLLEDKRTLSRNILAKNLAAGRNGVAAVLGARRLGLKLFLLAAVAAGYYLYQATGSYRITADAVLEGAVQRVVSAPFDGYVAASYRRAGDRVEDGELLGSLDDRDLRLELIQLTSERAQAAGQYREAQAAHERARSNIFKARMDQADARIALVQEQISRTELRSPFAGTVVGGDLSQSLGAAVERGEVLFEVAPLNDFRIILKVDERDVDYIELDQVVSVVLSAFPEKRLETRVNKVTPVSAAAEGRNYFRVEASYRATDARMRPGMEGVAKITIDERPLLWIWTRELVDWARLWLWRWLS